MIDTVAAHTKMQPENAIILPKWEGDLRDNELVSLIPFLEYAASMEFDDTRKVLESFEGKHSKRMGRGAGEAAAPIGCWTSGQCLGYQAHEHRI